MIPAGFDYRRAETLEEAIQLLQEHGEEAKIISGGHSLLPILKARLAQPGMLVDISRIPALSGILEEEQILIIGALTTHHEIESSPEVRKLCPLLAETAAQIGDVQVRNRGTIGGSISHADPAADYPAPLIALDAEFLVTGPDGARSNRAENFFEGTFETALSPNEILTSVHIPILGRRTGASYCKAAQQASGFAVCGVAALVELGDDGLVSKASVGITGVAGAAYRATPVEEAIAGKAPSAENIEAAAAYAADDIVPFEDLYATPEFRRHLAEVWTRRALDRAARMAGS